MEQKNDEKIPKFYSSYSHIYFRFAIHVCRILLHSTSEISQYFVVVIFTDVEWFTIKMLRKFQYSSEHEFDHIFKKTKKWNVARVWMYIVHFTLYALQFMCSCLKCCCFCFLHKLQCAFVIIAYRRSVNFNSNWMHILKIGKLQTRFRISFAWNRFYKYNNIYDLKANMQLSCHTLYLSVWRWWR